MKANDYIKKNGLEAAKKILSFRGGFRGFITLTDGSSLHSDELKELVESHELIKRDFETVEMAEYEYMVSASYDDPYWIRVKQAIADVESCKQ